MAEGGRLAENVVRFARTLRAAGLRVGPGRAHGAVAAAVEVGVASREDFYWALHAALVSRADERALFDEAFRLFWREPTGPLAPPPVPGMRIPPAARRDAARRVAEALEAERGGKPAPPRVREGEGEIRAWSDREVLRTRDFEQMSAVELAEAEKAVSALRLPMPDLATRRLVRDARGARVDPRASLRAALRTGPDAIPLRWRSPRTRPPLVVALCDVSGSMSRYARVVLRFLHALARSRAGVHAFTFGTRLTNVSRQLRHRDPDAALAAVGRTVLDWDGGTRIGSALREFNLRWSRRLLAQGALVLLVTDGLDRDAGHGLAEEMRRLHRSCRRLVWLNPLLRYEGFEPRAAGIRAMLPHVDEMRPVHDLESLAQLAAALGERGPAVRGGGPSAAAAGTGRRTTPTARA
ncbi:MAG TPA: VWA domain-containing protein [Anaeromyxobacter sp.]